MFTTWCHHGFCSQDKIIKIQFFGIIITRIGQKVNSIPVTLHSWKIMSNKAFLISESKIFKMDKSSWQKYLKLVLILVISLGPCLKTLHQNVVLELTTDLLYGSLNYELHYLYKTNTCSSLLPSPLGLTYLYNVLVGSKTSV